MGSLTVYCGGGGGHNSGTYSVRSGYFYLCRPPLPVCRPSPLWKAIKQLPTLPKVRIFAWRLGQDCLSIGSCVWVAGLGDGLCPLCSSVVETPLHAFRDCTDAVQAQRLGGFPDAVISSSASTMLDWLVASAGLLSRSDFAKLLLLLWNMWNRRNSLVHGSQPQPVWATVTSATLLHAVYLAANDQSRRPVSTTVFSPGVWSPPPLGTVAVPVDGAFSLDQGAGIGVVARDSTGSVLGGMAQHSLGPVSAEYAEAVAILAGLQFTRDRGYRSPQGTGH
ncbi:hypothetical protein V6N11_035751 [Hibiscus sabdariffa]|uniref:RNase H type-1 domain-containing protein n=1 Tax=Hibiscus sabdariffa TaxID=183260 RepID=A0ABR2R8E2_9ROSI